MNPVIVTLITGQQVICDLKEVFNDSEESPSGICLMMKHPYCLDLYEDEKVRFSKWCPYSIDTEFKIPYNSVIAIGKSDPNLEEAFLNKIEELEQLQSSENE
jgi:hypothetical protein